MITSINYPPGVETASLMCQINADGSTEYNWDLIKEKASEWSLFDTDQSRCLAKLLLALKPKD